LNPIPILIRIRNTAFAPTADLLHITVLKTLPVQVVELIKNSGDSLVLTVISVSEEEANKLENTDTLQSQVLHLQELIST